MDRKYKIKHAAMDTQCRMNTRVLDAPRIDSQRNKLTSYISTILGLSYLKIYLVIDSQALRMACVHYTFDSKQYRRIVHF